MSSNSLTTKLPKAERLEQLGVLSGGVEPELLLAAEGVVFCDAATPLVLAKGDVYFTDVGIFAFPYCRLEQERNFNDFSMALAGGALGVTVGRWVDVGIGAAKRANFRRRYEGGSAKERSLSLTKKYCQRGTFFPADELSNIVFPAEGTVELTFRGRRYISECQIQPKDISLWHEQAKAKREMLHGGPENPGSRALSEWVSRSRFSQEEFPWVLLAVKKTLKTGFRELECDLMMAARRLQHVESDSARILSDLIIASTKKETECGHTHSTVLGVVSAIALVSGLMIQNSYSVDSGPTGLYLVKVLLIVLGLVCLIAALAWRSGVSSSARALSFLKRPAVIKPSSPPAAHDPGAGI